MNSQIKEKAEACANLIMNSQSLVLLSGAGMSTSAGIPDFRGPNGIYRRQMETDPELIFDIEYFRKKPEFFYSFHKEFIREVEKVEPTVAHKFFASIEKKGRMLGIITQNIDALHQKAGSENVLEIHGSSWKNFCTRCYKEFDYKKTVKKIMNETIPLCDNCGGVIKPDIVFFGENVKYLYECQKMVSDADLLVVAGSSLVVTPAALLPSMCKGSIVVINKGEISYTYLPEENIDMMIEEDIDSFFTEVDKYISQD